MKDTTIAFVTFLLTIFLLIQIKLIGRLRKLKKIKGNITEEGFVLGAYDESIPEIAACSCCVGPCCMGFICGKCIVCCFGERIKDQREKRAHRQSDEVERRTTERRKKEQEKYLTEIEQEKIERKGRIEALRVNGYTATEEERQKVIELLSVNPKTNLLWTSNAVGLPIEEIVIILENEPDFEIRDEYIINKKKAVENICPNCENPFDPGSDFCSNCGFEL